MEPNIYSLEDHLISHDKIDSHAYYIIEKLRSEGHSAYLVGGSVRDLILHQRPKDFDIATSAKPEEIKKIFRRNAILIGRRFRLAHIRFGRKILEVSTFRAGDIEESALILKDNVWGSAEEDVLRRDFTINGLYYDPETQRVIDYVGGFEDAKSKLLKTIGTPELRFKQDPVRMIRLLKFRARFDFDIDDATLHALSTCKNELLKSSPARILEELQRMLESGASEPFFRLIHEHGFLELLIPLIAEELDKHKKSPIYDFLKEADSTMLKHYRNGVSRPTLLCCLLFPIIDKHILDIAKEQDHTLHLGQISEISKNIIHDCFSPFFRISRKLKTQMLSILTNQYRILPLDEKKREARTKIPRDEFFPLAIEFFKLRSAIDSSLLTTFTKWNEALIKTHEKNPPEKKKKRSYRKRTLPRKEP